MVDFYAFCRIVDDIADDPERPARQKREKLGLWRMAAESGFTGDGWLHPELSSIIDRHQIPINLFIEIIDGVSQDIEPVRYQTLDDLLAYCYQVASAVGLVSVRIFGCGEDEDALNYGINLGYCLQLTNIMRDVAEDFQNDGRIYLPIGIMDKFGYSEEELRAGKYTPNFVALMDFLYHEASHFYQLTASYIQPTFRPRLVATEMMVTVYRRILEKNAQGPLPGLQPPLRALQTRESRHLRFLVDAIEMDRSLPQGQRRLEDAFVTGGEGQRTA